MEYTLEGSVLHGHGWSATGDRQPPKPHIRRFFPSWYHLLGFLTLAIRFVVYTLQEWYHGREPFINIFRKFGVNKYVGVPLGGIGAGSISTDYRGGFGRFSLLPGLKEQDQPIVKANQFIVTVHKEDGSFVYQSLLSCANFETNRLSSWETMPEKNVSYLGLFPRALRYHVLGSTGVTVLVEHVSPVIPNNYKDTSLPVTNFELKIFNSSEEKYKVTVTFTFRNGTGCKKWDREGVCSAKQFEDGVHYGALLNHTIKKTPVTYAISTRKEKNSTTSYGTFDPNSDGSDPYNSLKSSGRISSIGEETSTELGIAISNGIEVGAGQSSSLLFNLTWHMPEVRFNMKKRTYRRRYTVLFNNPDQFEGTKQIATYALENHETWQKAISEWQAPIVKDERLPDWYKSALFNELYYVVDGAVVWFNYDDEWKELEPSISDVTAGQFRKYGRFGYMESWEYIMINTYDVHFYSSWAFVKNWPEIELSLQLDFADQVSRVDMDIAKSIMEGETMRVKSYGCLPHDLGNPMFDPWIHTNSYLLHDTAEWKDLNLKFVISSYRDYQLIGKKSDAAPQMLAYLYEKCKLIVEKALEDWDTDKDGMIENSGFADQTYDVWTMTGTSAYCGSLWIASLTFFIKMAEDAGYKDDVTYYSKVLQQALEAYDKKLWNGEFYSFDEDPSNEGVVMADQLSGIWAIALMDLELPLEKKKIDSAINSIYKYNVCSFMNGSIGAVNGFLTTGGVERKSIQSEEVWSGIVYAVASFMIEMNREKEGLHTAEGLFNSLWRTYPLQFQTPEAFTEAERYRAIGYMRPLSIWAMQHSLEKKAK